MSPNRHIQPLTLFILIQNRHFELCFFLFSNKYTSGKMCVRARDWTNQLTFFSSSSFSYNRLLFFYHHHHHRNNGIKSEKRKQKDKKNEQRGRRRYLDIKNKGQFSSSSFLRINFNCVLVCSLLSSVEFECRFYLHHTIKFFIFI